MLVFHASFFFLVQEGMSSVDRRVCSRIQPDEQVDRVEREDQGETHRRRGDERMRRGERNVRWHHQSNARDKDSPSKGSGMGDE